MGGEAIFLLILQEMDFALLALKEAGADPRWR
jgi:hypothetical protein